MDEVGAVDDAQRFPHIVVRDENADAALLEREDDLLHVGHGDGVDAAERLVHEEELRAGDEGAGDLEAAALAAGEGVGALLEQVVEPELVEVLLRARGVETARQADGLDDGADVLLDGEGAEDRGLLRQVAEAGAGALVHP